MELKKLKVNEIKPNPLQPREKFDREALQELANSIKIVGLVEPIQVEKTKDSYQLISGERRHRAHQLAGIKEIDAIIKDYRGNEIQKKKELLAANQHRQNLADWEEWKYIKEIANAEGWVHEEDKSNWKKGQIDTEQTSLILGIALGRLRDLQNAFEDTTKELRDAVRKDKISVSDAGRFISQLNQEHQKDIAIKAMETEKGIGRREIQEEIAKQKLKSIKKNKINVIDISKFKKAFISECGTLHKALDRFTRIYSSYKSKGLLDKIEVDNQIDTVQDSLRQALGIIK